MIVFWLGMALFGLMVAYCHIEPDWDRYERDLSYRRVVARRGRLIWAMLVTSIWMWAIGLLIGGTNA